jgi:hypothetical protein
MRETVLGLLVLGLAGCVHVPARYSAYQCVCASGAPPRFVLTLHAPTGSWGAGGHSLGLYRETGLVSITLPLAPTETRQRYSASDIAVEDASPYPAKPIAVTAGYVEVDRRLKRVDVALATRGGEFWANGSYPLRSE